MSFVHRFYCSSENTQVVFSPGKKPNVSCTMLVLVFGAKLSGHLYSTSHGFSYCRVWDILLTVRDGKICVCPLNPCVSVPISDVFFLLRRKRGLFMHL